MFIACNSRQKKLRKYHRLVQQSIFLNRAAVERRRFRAAQKQEKEKEEIKKLRANFHDYD